MKYLMDNRFEFGLPNEGMMQQRYVQNLDHPHTALPPVDRKWERRQRHAHGRIIPIHCRALLALKDSAVVLRDCPVPLDHIYFEGPYSFNVQTPSIVPYYGLE